MKYIDDFLNRITMYRLLLWGLRVLFVISWIFSATGVLPFGASRPLISISILIGVCLGANWILAKIYGAVSNSESSNITALLLYFIFQPPRTIGQAAGLALAGFVAIASKYVLAKHQRHIFNPVAFGAVFVGLTDVLHTRWWIGGSSMFIFVAILAILVVRKIHRTPMVLTFGAIALLLTILRADAGLWEGLRLGLFSFPIIYFGAFMLTEPITTPGRRYQQLAYAGIVAALLSSGARIGSVSMTPELSLVIANMVIFLLLPRGRQPLKLLGREKIGRDIYEYQLRPLRPLNFVPGQYVELTLPLPKNDSRGNRRSLSVASSPTEETVRFAVKHPEPSSAFKQMLAALPEQQVITANNIAGDFLLPLDDKAKLVFIAGGIGITPFRSMLKYLVDKRHSRSITLFYLVNDPKEIIFKDIFKEASEYGLKVVYVLTPPKGEKVPASWNGEVGFITSDMIRKHVLDYDKRLFYVSGPNGMVLATKKVLQSTGIKRANIKTDYFAGY